MTTTTPARSPGHSSIRAEYGSVQVDILDEIDPFYGVSAAAVLATLRANPNSPCRVLINSPGGDAFEGLALYEALRSHAGRVTVEVLSLAASAASVIAMAGDEVVMAPGAMIMIHDALTWTAGNEADHLAAAALLGKVSDMLAEIYAARAGGTASAWRTVMRQEGWFTAAEAVAAGLADRVAEPAAASTVAARAARRASVRACGVSLAHGICAGFSQTRTPARIWARRATPSAMPTIKALRAAGARPRGVLR